MFSSGTVPADATDTKLGISYQETSSSTVTNIRVVLEPFYAWKCVSTAIFSEEDIKKI